MINVSLSKECDRKSFKFYLRQAINYLIIMAVEKRSIIRHNVIYDFK